MKNNLINQNDKPADELIVISDECGDTLWDAVLQQEADKYEIKDIAKNAVVLLNSINAVQVCDATAAD